MLSVVDTDANHIVVAVHNIIHLYSLNVQDLVVSVVDTDDKDHVMGEYSFHISELLNEEDMLMEARPFYITNNSTITMRLCLRV